MSQFIASEELMTPKTPAILLRARERSAQRLMMAYAIAGLFFMVLPGTFLGVWNLLSISAHQGAAIPRAWIQAHGYAQIFGWIGTFIMGIGFYSIPKMTGRKANTAAWGWTAWWFWTAGALLRWGSGVYQWHWRTLLPLSAAFELVAFAIFFVTVKHHPAPARNSSHSGLPVWIVSVFIGTAGFATGLLMNLGGTIYVSLEGNNPAFPASFDSRFLALLAYGFIVPTIWGFSARWLPVFLGLEPVTERNLKLALLLIAVGVILAEFGLFHLASWFVAVAAVLSIAAFHLFKPAERAAKTAGVHRSFPAFVRAAYVWLLIAAALGICAAYLDHANGWIGASRHALTVGFISTMVFAIGQRVLPAFAGMRVLYSPRLMLTCLLLLNLGCALRVSSEVLAYEATGRPRGTLFPGQLFAN